jgi:chemotaxis signal transduction protein
MRSLPADQTLLEGREVHDCWNSIGVRGDKSCPELARHAHCRNCPAYAATAATLLDRDQHGTVDDDWKRDFAAEAPAEQRKTRSAILVRLGKEWFALPILLLDQVSEHRRIHSLPHRRSPALLGMVNVRGQLLICVSLAHVLGIAEEAMPTGDDRRRMIVMRCAGGRVVLPVDEVQHNCRFHDGELLPPPATVRKSQAVYTMGLLKVAQGMAALVDGDRLAEAVEQSLA